MPRLSRPLLLVLLLAVAFTASALHPYGHDIDTTERTECQICLHHSVNQPAAEHRPPTLPVPAFRTVNRVRGSGVRPRALALPVARARGPPRSA